MAKKKTSEKEIAGLYEIVAGFNVTDEDGKETRFEASKNKFVEPGNFTESQWKALKSMGAVVPVEEVVPEEEIAAEIVQD